MISIGLDKISLSFGEKNILENISFALNDSDKLGIVGCNGAGKTSLFKIITGQYSDYDGSVFISKGKTVGILKQNAIADSSLSVYDELLSAFSHLIKLENEISLLDGKMRANSLISENDIARYTQLSEEFKKSGGYEYKNRTLSYLHKLGFEKDDFNKNVQTLSGGQKTRLALGKLLLTSPDILLLDEPTNHLDIQTLLWLEELLSSSKQTLLVISHDRYFLDKICTKILDIENTHGKIYKGNYTAYAEAKRKDREIQQHHYDNQQREIARMEAFIEQQKRWNREKNIIAAESRQKAIDRMEKISAPDKLPDSIRLSFNAGSESGNDVLFVKKLSKKYGDSTIFSDVSFLIKRGDFAFILGKNGCGKSTLMKILRSRIPQTSGSFEYGHNIRIGYYDQENQELDENNTVLEELSSMHDKATQTELRSALALFLFKGDDVFKKVSSLSGGEKARLTFAKLILCKNNLLLLDEPTNHLDINSKEALEEALLSYKGTLIAVSHDRYFIKKLSTRIIDISRTPIMDCAAGYDQYLEIIQSYSNDNEIKMQEEQTNSGREKYIQDKKAAAEKRRAETQYKKTLEEIDKLENRLKEISSEEETYSTDYVKLSELNEERTLIDDKLLELYELWEQLEKQLNET